MNRQNEYNQESGTVIVFFVLILTILLGISAFVIDIGFLQWQKTHLQNTADAAALAGAREYIDGNVGDIEKFVKTYVDKNNILEAEIDSILLGKFDATNRNIIYDLCIDEFNIENSSCDTVTVILKGNRPLFFGRIFGKHESGIEVKATAIAAPISGISGLIPFAVNKSTADNFSNGTIFNLYGKNNSGNWGTVNFDQTGSAAPLLKPWTKNGYDGIISVGQQINTAPGANLNAFISALQSRIWTEEDRQYVIIPVIPDGSFKGTGQNPQQQPVTVLGFLAIEIITAQIRGQDIDVTARYLGTIEIGDVNPTAPNYNLQGLRLIK